ncbi:MAG TPA: hypothetical protein VK569_10360, partial [Bacteroidota bacterium]|nr:hypothetical protein [Bacteroidota bacterium]
MSPRIPRRSTFPVFFFFLLASVQPAAAQLNTVFSDIFNEVLKNRLVLSPGKHSNHFVPAANNANAELVPALNSLITGDISSFPLSSTSPRIGFDFSTGRPISVTQSLGPIMAEIAEPLGKGKLILEANYTYLDLNQLRG